MSGKQKLGQEPAMPCITKESKRLPYERAAETVDVHNPGMSKRLLIAKDVMCALLSNQEWEKSLGRVNAGALEGIELTVTASYQFADELLKQEGL